MSVGLESICQNIRHWAIADPERPYHGFEIPDLVRPRTVGANRRFIMYHSVSWNKMTKHPQNMVYSTLGAKMRGLY